jgi:hypothetical protein
VAKWGIENSHVASLDAWVASESAATYDGWPIFPNEPSREQDNAMTQLGE